MPSVNSSSRNPLIKQQSLADNHREHENDVYKNARISQAVQQWHSQTSNMYVLPPPADSIPTNGHANPNLSNSTDKTSNKDEIQSNQTESDKSTMTVKKRTTPVPASYARRRANIKNEAAAANLLQPNNKTKPAGASTKKPVKPSPIFIAPKKTSQQPHTYSTPLFDELQQLQRKNTLERQKASIDDQQNISPVASSMSSSSPVRFFAHSSASSLDDEYSSDESDHESLLIRKKMSHIKDHQLNLSCPSYFALPPTICITDPHGQSYTIDTDDHYAGLNDVHEQTNDSDPYSPVFAHPMEISPSPTDNSMPSSAILDKHPLHSIGEEEEDEDNADVNTFSKELNRIEALTRSRQPKVDVTSQEIEQPDKEPLSRRWSDGIVDQDKEKGAGAQSTLIKMPSVASVTKPTTTSPPVKLSKTKYILMKLHLTSANKDDESNMSSAAIVTNPPKKRTVHRSSDKKRYQTQ
ncbi:unnamed protein product [Adineta ricciae]|uniref:Uncharacterized protein n=1 Tax=Adineta ricciae TaxID=249248 RepID=A0A813Q1M2_ADIRI|nr:unnamed protein product [Adineta ricciae]CAF1139589.1 unnamed protein product [Adineta ricciae]